MTLTASDHDDVVGSSASDPATKPNLTAGALNDEDIAEDEVDSAAANNRSATMAAVASNQPTFPLAPNEPSVESVSRRVVNSVIRHEETMAKQHRVVPSSGPSPSTSTAAGQLASSAADASIVNFVVEGKRPTTMGAGSWKKCLPITMSATTASSVRSTFVPREAISAPQDGVHEGQALATDEQNEHSGAIENISISEQNLHLGYNCHVCVQQVPIPDPPAPPHMLLDAADTRRSSKAWNPISHLPPEAYRWGNPATTKEPVMIRRLLGSCVEQRDPRARATASLLPGTGGGVAGVGGAAVDITRGSGGTPVVHERVPLTEAGVAQFSQALVGDRDASYISVVERTVLGRLAASRCGGGSRKPGVLSPTRWSTEGSDEISPVPYLGAASKPQEDPVTTTHKRMQHEKSGQFTAGGMGTFFPVRPAYRRRQNTGRGRVIGGGSQRMLGGKGSMNIPVPTAVIATRGDCPLAPESDYC